MTEPGPSPFATLAPDREPTRTAKPAGMGKPKGAARGPTAGRWPMFNRFTDVHMATLTPAARAIWIILYRDTKRDGLAKTGQKDIARRAGTSTRAIRNGLKELTEAGLLDVVRPGTPAGGAAVYRIKLAGKGGSTLPQEVGFLRKKTVKKCGSTLPTSQKGTSA